MTHQASNPRAVRPRLFRARIRADFAHSPRGATRCWRLRIAETATLGAMESRPRRGGMAPLKAGPAAADK